MRGARYQQYQISSIELQNQYNREGGELQLSAMAAGSSLISFLALLLAAPMTTEGFEIASSSSPESVAVRAEGDLELWCNADGWWEWCRFVHEPSGRDCDLRDQGSSSVISPGKACVHLIMFGRK